MVAHACNPTLRREAGGSWVQGQPGLENEILMKTQNWERTAPGSVPCTGEATLSTPSTMNKVETSTFDKSRGLDLMSMVPVLIYYQYAFLNCFLTVSALINSNSISPGAEADGTESFPTHVQVCALTCMST